MDDFQSLVNHPKYARFDIHQTSYKEVNGHKIATEVFVPHSLVAKVGENDVQVKRPFIIRFHGGALIHGMSLYPDWFPLYLLEYAYRHAVPIVSADHRLMPECKGMDIMDDLESFWEWLHKDNDGLQSLLSASYPLLQIDKTRILAEGESAGGYIDVQAALSGLPGLRAVISAYPMLDLRDRYYQEKFEKIMVGVPMLPPEIITDHLNTMKPGAIVSRELPPARGDLGAAIIQQGRYVEFLGEEDILYPVDRLRLGLYSGKPMPRLWIYHGKQDTGIPSVGSEVFVREARAIKLWPESELRLDLPDGEHGLHKDKDLDTTDWLRDGVAWIEEAWLGGGEI